VLFVSVPQITKGGRFPWFPLYENSSVPFSKSSVKPTRCEYPVLEKISKIKPIRYRFFKVENEMLNRAETGIILNLVVILSGLIVKSK
jgi:hypothetical protein